MPPDPPRRAPKIFLGPARLEKFLGPASHPPWQNPGSALDLLQFKLKEFCKFWAHFKEKYVDICIWMYIYFFNAKNVEIYISKITYLFFGSFQSLKESIFQITYLSNSLPCKKCQIMYFKINIFVSRFLPSLRRLNLPNSNPSKTMHICIYKSQGPFCSYYQTWYNLLMTLIDVIIQWL